MQSWWKEMGCVRVTILSWSSPDHVLHLQGKLSLVFSHSSAEFRMKTLALGPFQGLSVFADDRKIGRVVNNEGAMSVIQTNWIGW